MPSVRQELLRLLATKSFRLGEFKLSSGGTSDYYIDCRTTTLDARGAQLTGQVFLEEIRSHGWNVQAIGGLTMGADPIVVAVAVNSGNVHGFLVRKAEKQHGIVNGTGNRSVARIWLRSCRCDVSGGERRSRWASGRRKGCWGGAVCGG